MLHRLCTLCALSPLFWAQFAWAGDGPTPPHHTFGGQIIFWSGALIIVWLMGRQVFKEQLNERRTIRRLVNEIGPFYPELDPMKLEQWVRLCAPHIWNSWASTEMPDLDAYTTPEYRASLQDELDASRASGLKRECRLVKVLKVHTIGIYMVGPGPAPRDVELMLRVESKAEDCTRDANGRIIDGQDEVRQLQHFWALKHDGHRIYLHGVWTAEGDMTDLAKRVQPPPVNEWCRPENSSGTSTS